MESLQLENGVQQMPVRLTLTGNRHYMGGIPGHTIIYDKKNAIVIAIRKASLFDAQQLETRKNDGVGHGKTGEFEIAWFRFSAIVTIERHISMSEIEKLLDEYVDNDVLDQEQKDYIRDRIEAKKTR